MADSVGATKTPTEVVAGTCQRPGHWFGHVKPTFPHDASDPAAQRRFFRAGSTRFWADRRTTPADLKSNEHAPPAGATAENRGGNGMRAPWGSAVVCRSELPKIPAKITWFFRPLGQGRPPEAGAAGQSRARAGTKKPPGRMQGETQQSRSPRAQPAQHDQTDTRTLPDFPRSRSRQQLQHSRPSSTGTDSQGADKPARGSPSGPASPQHRPDSRRQHARPPRPGQPRRAREPGQSKISPAAAHCSDKRRPDQAAEGRPEEDSQQTARSLQRGGQRRQAAMQADQHSPKASRSAKQQTKGGPRPAHSQARQIQQTPAQAAAPPGPSPSRTQPSPGSDLCHAPALAAGQDPGQTPPAGRDQAARPQQQQISHAAASPRPEPGSSQRQQGRLQPRGSSPSSPSPEQQQQSQPKNSQPSQRPSSRAEPQPGRIQPEDRGAGQTSMQQAEPKISSPTGGAGHQAASPSTDSSQPQQRACPRKQMGPVQAKEAAQQQGQPHAGTPGHPGPAGGGAPRPPASPRRQGPAGHQAARPQSEPAQIQQGKPGQPAAAAAAQPAASQPAQPGQAASQGQDRGAGQTQRHAPSGQPSSRGKSQISKPGRKGSTSPRGRQQQQIPGSRQSSPGPHRSAQIGPSSSQPRKAASSPPSQEQDQILISAERRKQEPGAQQQPSLKPARSRISPERPPSSRQCEARRGRPPGIQTPQTRGTQQQAGALSVSQP